MKLQQAYQLTWCQILLIHYTRATQMAVRDQNPDLWMATAGPRQPLKGVFYTQKFYPKILCFWPYI